MTDRMDEKAWAQQHRWLSSPAKKLYEEAERARASEGQLVGLLCRMEREHMREWPGVETPLLTELRAAIRAAGYRTLEGLETRK